jgi:dipeptidyl aminopeptidase/acylaminoacyl peptidase
MGGLAALVYTYYAKHTPVCCAANSPVCDLPYHYTERPDLPRTLYHAFCSYQGSFEDALMSASPLHLADRMPDIPYFIIHGDADTSVNKQKHSDRFVAELKKKHRVEYVEVPGMRHCKMTFRDEKMYYDFIIGNIVK